MSQIQSQHSKYSLVRSLKNPKLRAFIIDGSVPLGASILISEELCNSSKIYENKVIWVSDKVSFYRVITYNKNSHGLSYYLLIIVLNVGIQFRSFLILSRMGYYFLGFRVPDFIT